MGGLLEGGPKGMLPPSQIIGGAWPPAPPHSSYAYAMELSTVVLSTLAESCLDDSTLIYKL